MNTVLNILESTIRTCIPILFATLGMIVAERAGVLNISAEGFMLTGAFAAFAGVKLTDNLLIGLLFALGAAVIMCAIFCCATLFFNCRPSIVGIALNMFSIGITGFLYRSFFYSSTETATVNTFKAVEIPVLKDIPILGQILFRQNAFVYAALIMMLVVWVLIYKSFWGISIIAVGEHPHAAASMGIHVKRVRILCMLFSSAMIAIGGAYLSIVQSNTFIENMTNGRGYIALALTILSKWNPFGALGGAFLFGGAQTLQMKIQASTTNIPYNLVLMLPYVLTLVVVVIANRKEVNAPSGLGKVYHKS